MKRKNKFYHFGDSFAFNNFNFETASGRARIQPGGFGWRLAKHFGLEYQFEAMTGDSNEGIFSKIIHLNDFIKGDIILINWSFFSRSWYLDKDEALHSTNHWFDDNHGEYNDDIDQFENFIKDNESFMDFLLENNYEITKKLFSGFVTPYLKTLEDRGVKIYHMFIRANEKLKLNNKDRVFEVSGLPGEVIHFYPNYFDWLNDKNWKNEEQGHYTKDIQGRLATEIINKIQKNIL